MTLCIAHRGEPVGHRENTLASFAAAGAAGADMVELDCRLTRDGHVVVLHDPTLSRLWGRDERVTSLDLSEVSALGEGRQRIPTLAAAFEAVPLPVMVDVDDPDVMPATLRTVDQVGAFERSLFAGDLEGLRWLRRARPDARIALSWGRWEPPSTELLDELRPEFFNPRFDLLDDDAVKSMHGRGIGISVWTVDEERVMRELIGRGVDAIISNRIGSLVKLLSAGTPGGRGPRQGAE
jgi:glycerophosphoryl diester phosphodiesterase